jgi:hypothetical protein
VSRAAVLQRCVDRRMTDGEDDREFRDFIESISVTKEELAAIARALEFSSMHNVEGHLLEGTQNIPPKQTHPWKSISKPAALSGAGAASLRTLWRLAVVRSNPD